ncbi:NusG domain II-containing protein [Lactococcus cremoris]
MCVQTGWTNSPLKSIVCLPHNTIITIKPIGPIKNDNKTVDYVA